MYFKKISILFFTFGLFIFVHSVVAVEVPQSLKDSINEKAKALQEVNQKISQLQGVIEETADKGKTLQKEIKNTNNLLSQLNLNIKASEITIDKLKLEIESLDYDIGDVKLKINYKKSGIAELLKEIQRKDRETTLAVLLKNKSLSESMAEFENLMGLNEGISKEVVGLQSLEDDLSGKLNTASQKKGKVELENKNLSNKKIIAINEKQDQQVLLQQTKNQEKLYQDQLSELKKVQNEILKEIDKIESELRRTIDKNLLPMARPGVIIWPVDGGRLTQGYGRTSFAIANYSSQWHNGIDIGAPIGTELFAAESGTVINVGNQDAYSGCKGAAYGKFIVIKHENGLATLYSHLSRQIVSIGQKVERGQTIGYVGKSGWATGPHLHFTVFASQTFTPARSDLPEGTRPSRVCGPMPVGGDLDPTQYLDL